jgi:hypothetical protein
MGHSFNCHNPPHKNSLHIDVTSEADCELGWKGHIGRRDSSGGLRVASGPFLGLCYGQRKKGIFEGFIVPSKIIPSPNSYKITEISSEFN